MTMVERVAAAMKKRAAEPLYNISTLEPVLVGSLGDAWKHLARAAIVAMREPTEDMCEAGEHSNFLMWSPEEGEGLDGANMEKAWHAMIDAALKETGDE